MATETKRREQENAGPVERVISRYALYVEPQGEAPPQEPLQRLASFVLVWLAQLATIIITWTAWQVRSDPPNLPIVPLPAVSFGPLLLITLALVPIWPRRGVMFHGAAMLLALAWDQQRLEPQFFALWLLLWACVSERGAWFTRWFLASMWLWAGLHKLFSPEWLGVASWNILERAGFDPEHYFVFAIAVAVVELAAGVAAIFTRRIAAVLCFLVHAGILLFLSPWFYNWNLSVWPWNAATAVVGGWLFWNARAGWPRSIRQWVVVVLLYVVPATYYLGWINPHLANVLYSNHMPKAWLSGADGRIETLHGWFGLQVPFPDSHALFVQRFERIADVGEKLYIQDPRQRIDDRYFLLERPRVATEIEREAFYDTSVGTVVGFETDDANAAFLIDRIGGELTVGDNGMVMSVLLEGEEADRRAMELLSRLPNVRELKIHRADLAGELSMLARLRRLEILDLAGSKFSAERLAALDGIDSLGWLNLADSNITTDDLRYLPNKQSLVVLHLARTSIDDTVLATIGEMESLTMLDLAGTNLSGKTFGELRDLSVLLWLDLSNTAVDDEAIAKLRVLPRLEVLNLQGTSITDDAIDSLANLSMLEHLDLRETAVTQEAILRLQRKLPHCEIVR